MRGKQVVLAVLAGLLGGVAALMACGGEPEPSLPRTLAAWCEHSVSCGQHSSLSACEQELAELDEERLAEAESNLAAMVAEGQDSCIPLNPVGTPCYAPRPNAKFLLHGCQFGLFCDGETLDSGTCQPWREEGSACRTSLECAPSMHCAGASPQVGQWGLCAKKPGLGEDCASTLFRDCARGLTCSEASGRCVPLARVGEPCGAEARCRPGSACLEGLCAPNPASP
jgi:hypothetical protein